GFARSLVVCAASWRVDPMLLQSLVPTFQQRHPFLTNPAFWSALAAFAAASTSWLFWRNQRHKQLEETLPRLVLEKWVRRPEHHWGRQTEVLTASIRNVGKGFASFVVQETKYRSILNPDAYRFLWEAPYVLDDRDLPYLEAGNNGYEAFKLIFFWE